MEVCPLARGMMSPQLAQFLSAPLQGSLRFLHLPLPALLSVCLTAHFPCWEKCGLTTFLNLDSMG